MKRVLYEPLSSPAETEKRNYWKRPLFIFFGILTAVIILILLWLFLLGGIKNKNVQTITQTVVPQTVVSPTRTPTSITGTLNFEGYAPSDSYIAITERLVGRTDFKDVVSGLVPGQDTTWTWKDATKGLNYEIKATLKSRGKIINESSLTSVSAPATKVALTLISSQKPAQPKQTAISGKTHLDGYIPPNSSLVVLSRPTGNGNLTPVVTGVPVIDGNPWSWKNAIVGETYDVDVQLRNSSGKTISTNGAQTITAPASGILFMLTSTAQPPAPAITGISGTITVNGDIPTNSYISLGARPAGTTTSFNEIIPKLTATNNVAWNWDNAQVGTQYEIQAYLWANGAPYAQSNSLTVTAPSKNNLLTINAQQILSAPASSTLSVTCNGSQNNLFQATINYNTDSSIQNASQYKVVVTQTSNGSQVVNTTLTPGTPNQQQTLTTGYQFTSGTTYYAQYAYSTSTAPLSSLSSPVQFSCH